jgi:alkylation response protein AidB-like acyl-CoA dehydrogenase
MIDLLPSPDDEAIIDSVRSFITSELPVGRFRQADWTPGDFNRWRQIANLGWFTGAEPESGLDIAAEALIFRELGRILFSPSALSTLLAAHLAKAQGLDDLAGELMDGRGHAALAYAVPVTDRGYALQIVDAHPTSLILTADGDSFALWERTALVHRAELRPFDPTVALSAASFTPGAQPLARSEANTPDLLLRARVLTAAMCVGSAEASQDLAVDYAKIREAFGRVIGAFQAIQHQCANMAVRSEAARDQTLMAALCVREEMFGAEFQAAAAAIVATDAALENAAACIQVHGGMGFTFECEAHFHLKRAHLLKWLWDGPRAAIRRLLEPAPLYQAVA